MISKRHIKIIFSLVLLGYVARSVDFGRLTRLMMSIPLTTVCILCGGYFIGQVLSSLKWWILARSCRLDTSFLDTLRIYFTAMFVNLAGIGTLGGDMLRGILIGSSQAKKTVGIATVIADRVHGLAVLAALGSVSIGVFSGGTLPATFAVALCVLGAAIMLGWFIGPRVLLAVMPASSFLHQKTADFSSAFPTQPRTIMTITLVSLVFHLLQVSLHLSIASGLGIQVSVTTLLTIVPFINIVSSLPISWQGLGVRETAYKFFFVPTICSTEQAVAFGALWLLAITSSALVGGLVGFLSRAIQSDH